MTKMIKWWKRYSFWNKIKLFLIPFTVGNTLAVYFTDASSGYYFLPVVFFIITHLIDVFIKDEDGDNIVDKL